MPESEKKKSRSAPETTECCWIPRETGAALGPPSARPAPKAPQVQGGAVVPLAPRLESSGRFGLGLGLGPAPSFGLDLEPRAASGRGLRAATSLTPRSRVALRMNPCLGATSGRDVTAAIARSGSSPSWG